MNFYIDIMTGIAIGGVVGFVASYIATSKIKKRSRLAEIDNFNMKGKAILQDVVNETSAANGVLLHIHNSGGELTVGTVMYSSAIVEAPEDINVSVIDNWQKILVDSEYRQLIEQLHTRKSILMLVDKMPESLLKRTYESMGVVGSMVFEVYDKTDSSYLYVSFPVKNNLHETTGSKEFIRMEYAVNKLRNLCREYHRIGVLN